jgi:alpha-methylacyl-CoA racemase
MLLADMGADVIRVDRVGQAAADSDSRPGSGRILNRGKRSISLDLKHPDGLGVFLSLAEKADIILEPFRPGVAERLGFGPAVCAALNPRLIYGRVTGWGQEGPLSKTAGHDINYLALSGLSYHIGRAGEGPMPLLPLVGDFAGGAMLSAFGIMCAVFEAQRSGQGQVVDAAMLDGAVALTALYHELRADGLWNDRRGTNFNDGGAHYYNLYQCADGEYLAVGAYEDDFYDELLSLVNLSNDTEASSRQHDPASWPQLTERLEKIFRQKTRSEWCEVFDGTDACVTPVLSMAEAPSHPHNKERLTFVDYGGVTQPAPSPRLSRTPGSIQGPSSRPGQHTDEILAEWLDLGHADASRLRMSGAAA